MNDDTLSSQDIRLAVPHLPKVAQALLNKGKKYDALILELLKYDPFTEEDRHFPTNKELQAILKLTSGQLRLQLVSIYEDFLTSMNDSNTTFNFGNILVEFYVRGYYKRSITFYARINQLPRVGEQLEMPFLKPHFNVGAFYVQSINHTFENDAQNITIWVKEGFYNLFEHLELEQAKSESRYDWKTDSITEPAAKQQSYSSSKRYFGAKQW
jgi:hypothetical protein